MVKYLMTATMLAVLSFAPISLAQTADDKTPAEETVCDEFSGALYGLCVADCEAMDCPLGDPFASYEAGEQVLTNYTTLSEGNLPQSRRVAWQGGNHAQERLRGCWRRS